MIQPEVKDEFIKKLTAVNEIKSLDVQSICLMIGTLQISELLEPNLIKLIIINMNNSIEHLSLQQVSKLYLAISRVYDNTCFQEYEIMKSRVFQKVEEAKEISMDDVLTLSLPLSIDGLGPESKVWTKFQNTVIDNQNHLKLQDAVVICQSFSNINFESDTLWMVLEKKF